MDSQYAFVTDKKFSSCPSSPRLETRKPLSVIGTGTHFEGLNNFANILKVKNAEEYLAEKQKIQLPRSALRNSLVPLEDRKEHRLQENNEEIITKTKIKRKTLDQVLGAKTQESSQEYGDDAEAAEENKTFAKRLGRRRSKTLKISSINTEASPKERKKSKRVTFADEVIDTPSPKTPASSRLERQSPEKSSLKISERTISEPMGVTSIPLASELSQISPSQVLASIRSTRSFDESCKNRAEKRGNSESSDGNYMQNFGNSEQRLQEKVPMNPLNLNLSNKLLSQQFEDRKILSLESNFYNLRRNPLIRNSLPCTPLPDLSFSPKSNELPYIPSPKLTAKESAFNSKFEYNFSPRLSTVFNPKGSEPLPSLAPVKSGFNAGIIWRKNLEIDTNAGTKLRSIHQVDTQLLNLTERKDLKQNNIEEFRRYLI